MEKKIIEILEEMMQDDYELYIRTSGYSHFDEADWEWLIEAAKEKIDQMKRENRI